MKIDHTAPFCGCLVQLVRAGDPYDFYATPAKYTTIMAILYAYAPTLHRM